jgi:plasmid stabilization system protein ParE
VTASIAFHPDARRERIDATRFYARRDPRVAERFTSALRAVVARIKEAPGQFRSHGLMAVTVASGPLFFKVLRAALPRPFPYVVFFYVRANVPIVLAIAHGKRRPGYWAERR